MRILFYYPSYLFRLIQTYKLMDESFMWFEGMLSSAEVMNVSLFNASCQASITKLQVLIHTVKKVIVK